MNSDQGVSTSKLIANAETLGNAAFLEATADPSAAVAAATSAQEDSVPFEG
jgi:hypothetical protein